MSDIHGDDGCIARLEESMICWTLAKAKTGAEKLEEHLRRLVIELAKSLPFDEVRSREIFNEMYDRIVLGQVNASTARPDKPKDEPTPSMEWIRLLGPHSCTYPYNSATGNATKFTDLPDAVVGTIATFLDLKSATGVFAVSSPGRCKAMKEIFFKKNINALFEAVNGHNRKGYAPHIFNAFIDYNQDWREVYERKESSYFGPGWNGALVKFARVFHDMPLLLRHDQVDVLRFFIEKGMIHINSTVGFIQHYMFDEFHASNNTSAEYRGNSVTTMDLFEGNSLHKAGKISVNTSWNNRSSGIVSSSSWYGDSDKSDRLLYQALSLSSPETIKYLLRVEGIDIHETACPYRSNTTLSILAHALLDKDVSQASFKLLLSNPHLDVHYTGTDEEDENITPLHLYFLLKRKYRDEAKLELLLARNDLDVNAREHENGLTPLHYAVLNDKKLSAGELRRLLSHSDININAVDHDGATPLHYAIKELKSKGKEENGMVVEMLIESGADPHFQAEGS